MSLKKKPEVRDSRSMVEAPLSFSVQSCCIAAACRSERDEVCLLSNKLMILERSIRNFLTPSLIDFI